MISFFLAFLIFDLAPFMRAMEIALGRLIKASMHIPEEFLCS